MTNDGKDGNAKAVGITFYSDVQIFTQSRRTCTISVTYIILLFSVAGLNIYGFTGRDVTLKCKSNIFRGKVTWKYINKSIPGSHWKRIATVSAAGSTNIAVRSPFVGRIKVQSNGNLKISKVNFQDNVRIMCEVSGGTEGNILTQRTFFKLLVPNCLSKYRCVQLMCSATARVTQKHVYKFIITIIIIAADSISTDWLFICWNPRYI